ncbi:unnamed protein product, partial [Rotaria sp. Silwood1]
MGQLLWCVSVSMVIAAVCVVGE